MPRKPRFTPPGHYLHLTQRGNYGQPTFYTDADRRIFLQLVSQYAQLRQVSILAYCLMPNHYHILARAGHPDDIPRFMQGVNGRYSAYLHGRLVRKGRLWQARYYSCVLGFGHLFSALRYVERNPLRARMVDNAATYPWSSAPFHTTRATPPTWLDMDTFPNSPIRPTGPASSPPPNPAPNTH